MRQPSVIVSVIIKTERVQNQYGTHIHIRVRSKDGQSFSAPNTFVFERSTLLWDGLVPPDWYFRATMGFYLLTAKKLIPPANVWWFRLQQVHGLIKLFQLRKKAFKKSPAVRILYTFRAWISITLEWNSHRFTHSRMRKKIHNKLIIIVCYRTNIIQPSFVVWIESHSTQPKNPYPKRKYIWCFRIFVRHTVSLHPI